MTSLCISKALTPNPTHTMKCALKLEESMDCLFSIYKDLNQINMMLFFKMYRCIFCIFWVVSNFCCKIYSSDFVIVTKLYTRYIIYIYTVHWIFWFVYKHLQFGLKTFACRAPKLWNDLPLKCNYSNQCIIYGNTRFFFIYMVSSPPGHTSEG